MKKYVIQFLILSLFAIGFYQQNALSMQQSENNTMSIDLIKTISALTTSINTAISTINDLKDTNDDISRINNYYIRNEQEKLSERIGETINTIASLNNTYTQTNINTNSQNILIKIKIINLNLALQRFIQLCSNLNKTTLNEMCQNINSLTITIQQCLKILGINEINAQALFENTQKKCTQIKESAPYEYLTQILDKILNSLENDDKQQIFSTINNFKLRSDILFTMTKTQINSITDKIVLLKNSFVNYIKKNNNSNWDSNLKSLLLFFLKPIIDSFANISLYSYPSIKQELNTLYMQLLEFQYRIENDSALARIRKNDFKAENTHTDKDTSASSEEASPSIKSLTQTLDAILNYLKNDDTQQAINLIKYFQLGDIPLTTTKDEINKITEKITELISYINSNPLDANIINELKYFLKKIKPSFKNIINNKKNSSAITDSLSGFILECNKFYGLLNNIKIVKVK